MPHSLFPHADAETRSRLETDELVRLTNSFDWAATPLGCIDTWPEALRSAVRIVLTSRVPMVLLAGQGEGILIYNSGYATFAGDRHPSVFGRPALVAWPEIADFNRENMRRGFAGETWYLADQELVLNRHGYFESAFLNLNYSPVLNEAGKVLAVLVSVIETTDRVKAERALARSQEKLELALKASGLVGTWDWDIAADRITADERFAQLFSINAADASVGLPLANFLPAIHPDDRERVQREIEAAVRRPGPMSFEYRLVQSDGSIRYVVASGTTIAGPDGWAARLPGVIVDVTEQRKVAEQLIESELRFRTLADTMPQMVWSTLANGFHDYYNARWYEFTGMPVGTTDGDGWNGVFHPDDQTRAWEVWRQSLATGEPYHIEYRLRHHSGDYRWVLGQALPMRSADGVIVRWFGTCTDIHETKLAQEEREVIAQELSHRIKNIFAVIGGIVSLAARQHPEAADFAERLRARIFALGRAHDFVRPHSKASQPRPSPSSLQSLILQLLEPYRSPDDERVSLSGDDAAIDDGAATPLALLFHELATNAAKYGALSHPDGRIEIRSKVDGEVYRLTWAETGAAASNPSREGFGSRLIALSVQGQLRGRIDRNWGASGLSVEVELPLASLSRRASLN
jgi:PAS domain S-box-containing protein